LKAAVNLLDTQPGRRWFFAALYVSEGAPMGFIWWALPTLLARQGVSLADITLLTSTATLPWVFKFIAGPLIDASSVRRVPLRTWILTCQAVMILALVPVALLDWANDFTLLLACLVSHAVFAATQDVAIDTLAIRSVPAEELGRVNGWMQAGMLAGRAAIAAGSLLLVNLAGPAAVIAVLALIIALPMLLVMMAIREPAAPAQDATGARSGLAVIASATAIVGLLIALTAGAGFEFFSTAIGPLLVDIGASDNTVSLFFGLLAPGGLIAGALLSASFTDRLGAGRATGAGVLAAGLMISGLAVLLNAGLLDHRVFYLPALATVYIAIGFLTAASYALFMQLARGPFSATRFSLFMAMTNGCEAWAGFAGGRMKEPLGYAGAFLVLVVVSLLSLPLLWMLARLRRGAAKTTENS